MKTDLGQNITRISRSFMNFANSAISKMKFLDFHVETIRHQSCGYSKCRTHVWYANRIKLSSFYDSEQNIISRARKRHSAGKMLQSKCIKSVKNIENLMSTSDDSYKHTPWLSMILKMISTLLRIFEYKTSDLKYHWISLGLLSCVLMDFINWSGMINNYSANVNKAREMDISLGECCKETWISRNPVIHASGFRCAACFI